MTDEQRSELVRLADKAEGGLLQPESVVAAAKREQSPLHPLFEWDNGEAAKLYRINQARSLIRLVIQYLPAPKREVRYLVSLPTDRIASGGYRKTSEVLDRPDWRAQLVEEARKRVAGLRGCYSHLPELDQLWSRLDMAFDDYLARLRDVPQAG